MPRWKSPRRAAATPTTSSTIDPRNPRTVAVSSGSCPRSAATPTHAQQVARSPRERGSGEEPSSQRTRTRSSRARADLPGPAPPSSETMSHPAGSTLGQVARSPRERGSGEEPGSPDAQTCSSCARADLPGTATPSSGTMSHLPDSALGQVARSPRERGSGDEPSSQRARTRSSRARADLPGPAPTSSETMSHLPGTPERGVAGGKRVSGCRVPTPLTRRRSPLAS